MKSFLAFISLLSFTVTANAQLLYDWSFSMPKAISILEVAEDHEKNLLLCGYQSFGIRYGTANFSNQGLGDIFILKVDSAHNLKWLHSYGSSDNDWAQNISVDDSGNVYVGGYFHDSIDVDASAGVKMLRSAGRRDGFYMKLDPNGKVVWAKTIGTPNHDEVAGFRVDHKDNLWIYATYGDSLTYSTSSGPQTIYGNHGDLFLAKMSRKNGNVIWQRNWRGYGNATYSMTIDRNQNIYLEGGLHRTVAFDLDPEPNMADTFFLKGNNLFSSFLMRISKTGDFKHGIKLESYFRHTDVVHDRARNVYIAGIFHEAFDVDPSSRVRMLRPKVGKRSSYVAKFDKTLKNLNWVHDFTGNVYVFDFEIVNDNSLFVTGEMWDTTDFDPGPGVARYIGSHDFLLHLDTAGNFKEVWATQNSGNITVNKRVLASQRTDQLIMGGTFVGAIDFDPGPATKTLHGETFVMGLQKGFTVGLEEVSADDRWIQLYPNPVQEVLRFQFEVLPENVTIELFDAQGRSLEHIQGINTQQYEMPFPYAAGSYVVRINDGETIYSKKLIKQ